MSLRAALLAVAVMVAAGAVVFTLFQRQLSGASFAFGTHPEVLDALERSLDDQKRLARLDPAGAEEYRQRFDGTERTLGRLHILELNREELLRRYEAILLAVFLACAAAAAAVYVVRQSRLGPRLDRLQGALTRLAEGEVEVALDDRGRDVVARIAAMVERTSRRMASDRRRLRALKELSAWQQAARRQAHELRTPLTAAELELERAGTAVAAGDASAAGVALASAREELTRLAELTGRFASFARLPPPRLERRDIGALLGEFVDTYRAAWPGLRLAFDPPPAPAASDPGGRLAADADRDLLRQVLVNLCDNSARAAGDAGGTVTLALRRRGGTVEIDVADDGPGVPPALAGRVFEPYVGARGGGEGVGLGLGLGLAISRKILLDHGGDLELAATSAAGTLFRLTLPAASAPGGSA